jgi:hypothetical protein
VSPGRKLGGPRNALDGAKGGASHRKHPRAEVGNVFGCWTVVRLLASGVAGRTSNEQVRVRCSCGEERPHFVFNLRNASKVCFHAGSRYKGARP